MSAFATQYDIGGPRQIVAVVEETGNNYRMLIRFLPVGCFDRVTNEKINRLKSLHYAALSLSKYLKISEDRQLILSGLSPLSFVQERNECRTEIIQPKDGIKIEKIRSREIAQGVRKTDESILKTNEMTTLPGGESFLERKADYLDTIRFLYVFLLQDFPDKLEKDDDFYLKITSIEERSKDFSAGLLKNVTEDRLLLTLERKDIEGFLNRLQSDLLNRLRKHVEDFESTHRR